LPTNDLARRVFLSHNSADKPFVLGVADRLREDGITFFLAGVALRVARLTLLAVPEV